MKISSLINQSFDNFLNNSDNVRVKSAKKIIDKTDNNPTVLAILYSKFDNDGKLRTNPPLHKVYIKGLNGPDKRISDSNIEISCDCEAFLYWCEVALYRKKAAQILHSNGEPPVVRNPKMIPSGCKHTIKIALIINNKGL